MNNQPKFKKGDSPVVDMLAIPDDHVWPVEPTPPTTSPKQTF